MSTGRELELYPTSVAAERLGVTPQSVRNLCRRGEITHFKDKSGRFLLTGHEIEEVIQRRQARESEG